MANILGGVLGAATGFLTGGPAGAAAAGAAGLLGGGGGQMSAAQKAALKQQRAIANQLYGYGTSAPMTNQEDLNNLAQATGLLGQQERSGLGSLAAFGNPMLPTGGAAAQLGAVQARDQGNRMALSEQHLQDAVAARRQALLQAAGVNQAAFGMASAPGATPPNPLGATLAQAAQTYAYRQAAKAPGKKPAGPNNQGLTVGDWEQLGYNVGEDGTVYDPEGQVIYSPTGAGDPPEHAPILLALMILHHLIRTQKPARPRRKPKGAGDLPPVGYQLGMLPGGTAGPQGAQAPGNEPGGMNTVRNQIRRPAETLTDRIRFASGVQLPY